MTEKGIVLCTACLNPYKGTLRRSLTNWNTAIAFSLGRPSSSNNLMFAGAKPTPSAGVLISGPISAISDLRQSHVSLTRVSVTR
ncbi:hypothetical protein WJX82_003114 [Trebouxia sp. C0006]